LYDKSIVLEMSEIFMRLQMDVCKKI